MNSQSVGVPNIDIVVSLVNRDDINEAILPGQTIRVTTSTDQHGKFSVVLATTLLQLNEQDQVRVLIAASKTETYTGGVLVHKIVSDQDATRHTFDTLTQHAAHVQNVQFFDTSSIVASGYVMMAASAEYDSPLFQFSKCGQSSVTVTSYHVTDTTFTFPLQQALTDNSGKWTQAIPIWVRKTYAQ